MDLNELKVVDTIKFFLVHPATGVETNIEIEAYGPYSKKYKNAMHRLRNDKVINSKRKQTSEQIEENGIRLVAALVKNWNNMELGKEQVECTPENVLSIFKKYPWIFEQIEEKTMETSNFLSNANGN